jgi:WD40 repeat protein
VPIPASPAYTLTDPGGTGVYGVAFTRNGTLASGDLNGSVYLWNVTKDKVTGTFPDSNGQGIFGIAISPNGKTLAADTLNDLTYGKGAVVLWDPPAVKPVATLTAPDGQGFGNPPALSPDDATVAAANADGSIYLWDTTTGKPAGKPLTDPGTGVDYGIAFSPATGFLAAADHNGTAYLWNTKQSRIAATFQDPDGRGVNAVAFSPDGSILATGDLNGNIYLWNAATGSKMGTLHGPKGVPIQGIAFSPRRGIVAATSNNSTDHRYVTCIWSLTRGALATFTDPNSAGATRVAFSPDGSLLAVGDENAHTYIWNMKGFSG